MHHCSQLHELEMKYVALSLYAILLLVIASFPNPQEPSPVLTMSAIRQFDHRCYAIAFIQVKTPWEQFTEIAFGLNREQKMADVIKSKYKRVSPNLIKDVVSLAHKYERDTFPTATDIVAIIGIESNFNPRAVSKLKVDPAVGLTQIRPDAWKHKIKRAELSTVEGQIRHGADILGHYYRILGNKEAAIRSYNVGLAAYTRGRYQEASRRYINKFNREVSQYQTLNVTPRAIDSREIVVSLR